MQRILLVFSFCFTITIILAVNWTGSVSTDWFTPGNWDSAAVPTSSTPVLIPGGLTIYPVISVSDASCFQIVISGGAQLTISNSGSLDVTAYNNISGALYFLNGGTMMSPQLSWHEGSSLSVTGAMAYFNITNQLYFNINSDIQMSSCYTRFIGTGNAQIINRSATSRIDNLHVSFTDTGRYLAFSDLTTHTLTIGNLTVFNGSSLTSNSNENVIISGNFLDHNVTADYGVKLDMGTVSFNGNGQSIWLNGPGSYLNHVAKNPSTSTICNFSHNTTIKGNLTVQRGWLDLQEYDLTVGGNLSLSGGGLDAVNSTVTLGGNISNTYSSGYFYSTGSTVIFNGSDFQYCTGNLDFNAVQVNKSGGALRFDNTGAEVNIAEYGWIAGAIDVLAGTVNIGNLADDKIYGSWWLSGGTINLLCSSTDLIDLAGDLHIFGGTMNVHGGYYPSYWPYGGNASIEMSGGTLDFLDQGVYVNDDYAWTFTENITGGTIRVADSFEVYRNDYNPTGGTVSMYSGTDAIVCHDAGSNLYNLHINKAGAREESSTPSLKARRSEASRPAERDNAVNATTNLDINGFFWLQSGTFTAPEQLSVQGDWFTNPTNGNFMEGTGTVTFDGSTFSQIMSGETYNRLVMNKTSLGGIGILAGCNVTCNSYDYTFGILQITGGSFTALDLEDEAMRGYLIIEGGSAHLHQDSGSFLDLNGILWVNQGGELHLYGGSDDHFFPYGGNSELNLIDGLIETHDRGIVIYNQNIFSNTITNGIIRSAGGFINQRPDFSMTSGTLELTSTADASIGMYHGSLHDVIINKGNRDTDDGLQQQSTSRSRLGALVHPARNNTASLIQNLNCRNLTVQSGQLNAGIFNLNPTGAVNINYGSLVLNEMAVLNLADGMPLNINNGGTLQINGTTANPATVTSSTGYYSFNVNPGGTLGAQYSVFEKMSATGVNVMEGAYVNPELPLTGCIFRNGVSGGTLLTIDNSQNLGILNAVFPPNTWSGASNVSKNTNLGMVNFSNATGSFSGESYDADFFDRLVWTTATATPDLRIIKAFWSDPSPALGESVYFTVYCLNVCTAAAGPCYLDFYYNLSEPPGNIIGNQSAYYASMPAGIPQQSTFMVYNDTEPGIWNSWLQIDVDQIVAESDETNNIYGPVPINWTTLALPPVENLAIHRVGTTHYKMLTWTYPVTASHFNIYRSEDSLFQAGIDTFIGNVGYPDMQFVDTTNADHYFYIVTAVQTGRAVTEAPEMVNDGDVISGRKGNTPSSR